VSEYTATIGLEIHAELSTQTKMFCACKNDPDEKRPNVHICPVCMAHPGSLPVINREAVRKVLLVGVALGATLADYTEFDRKNYFYPDIPKDYQISQYAYPLVSGGSLNKVTLTRIHLEEDTARSQHEKAESVVDYNRAGVPLMELVTEPNLHSGEEASSFARELQILLRYLGCAEANMEKGEMRVEANISVSKEDTLGTKVEVKNLNSFRSVEKAIEFEVDRQITALEAGKKLIQETRGWDESRQVTFSQRTKESSEDYRYLPDPDLPKLRVSSIAELSREALNAELPVLPWEKRVEYQNLGISASDTEFFIRDQELGNFFDQARKSLDTSSTQLVANYISSDLAGKREAGESREGWFNPTNAQRVADLVGLIKKGVLSSRGAKDTLSYMMTSDDSPEAIAKEHAFIQQSDSSVLESVIKTILEKHPSVVADFKAGKAASLQFLIGQAMKETKGSANPQVLKELFESAL
jgi:aspartyl-tRNA(Asn)/glutamyl-tRNA(Gln) amidotransferase subunit B